LGKRRVEMNEGIVALVGCQITRDGKFCGKPATWKAGTWWFCDEHIKLEEPFRLPPLDKGFVTVETDTPCEEMIPMWYTRFGSTFRGGVCKAEDYWMGDYPDSVVLVSQGEYEALLSQET
jgi:hypothetical protein